MDISVFTDKSKLPTNEELEKSIGKTYPYWLVIKEFVYQRYPKATEEWNFPGIKYGWSFRIKDKKRAIIYFLPRQEYFQVAFVFGGKATDIILQSDISDEIKLELKNAKVYAEGRGIRVSIKDENIIPDIYKLAEIKIAN